jgi:PhzF family phenazine biosynthesis protein
MKIPFYQIDAFASRVFAGNPAGVCFLEAWIDAGLMQAIAAENNLSETAFMVGKNGRYELRWFTPTVEVDLCGHATLASAFAVFTEREPEARRVEFLTQSGTLIVEREGDRLLMDFPARKPVPCAMPEDIGDILGETPTEALSSRDLMLVYETEEQILGLKPDMARVAALAHFAVIVTAPGRESDFVSRFFAPGAGVPEDPVTGSAHSTLIPYWAERLGRKELYARQLSARGGELFCKDRGERVGIGGRAVLYLSGTLMV